MPKTVKDRTAIPEGMARVKYLGVQGPQSRQMTATVEGVRRRLKVGESYLFPSAEARAMCASPFYEWLEGPAAPESSADTVPVPAPRKLKAKED